MFGVHDARIPMRTRWEIPSIAPLTLWVALALAAAPRTSTAQPASVPSAKLEPLGRSQFVRAVLAANPTLEAARHGARAALARTKQAGAWPDPLLEVGLAPLSIRGRVGYELLVSQRIPWFGKRALETSVAELEAKAAQSDYEATRSELALAATTLYDQYFVVERSLEVNSTHAGLLKALHADATARSGSGRGSALDVLQAEAELAMLERESIELGAQRDIVGAQMNELLHRAPEQSLPPPPSELELPEPSQAADASARQGLRARPELSAAAERVRAANARIEQAKRDYYPDLKLSTSYNSMWEMPEHRWMVGLEFDLPLPSGRRASAVDEARLMRAQRESEATRIADAARTELFVARKRLEESKQLLALFEARLLPVAEARIEASQAAYVTAQGSLASVLEAERNLRQLELERHTARAERARRHAELQRALGRVPGLAGKESNP